MKLSDLRPGTIFVTVNGGIRAVASEYHYPTGQVECILLASGEYAHFPNGNDELVREINLNHIIDARDAAIRTAEVDRRGSIEAIIAADSMNTLAYDLKQERDAAISRLAAALKVLGEVEWVYDADFGIEFCPSCFRSKSEGHEQGCHLAVILTSVKENGTPPAH